MPVINTLDWLSHHLIRRVLIPFIWIYSLMTLALKSISRP